MKRKKYHVIMRERSADMMGYLGRHRSGRIGFVNHSFQAMRFASTVNAKDMIFTCDYLQLVNEPCWIEVIS